MYSKIELEEKLKEHFDDFSGYYELKNYDDLHKFIWNYANDCWADGRKFGVKHSAE